MHRCQTISKALPILKPGYYKTDWRITADATSAYQYMYDAAYLINKSSTLITLKVCIEDIIQANVLLHRSNYTYTL